MEPAMKLRVSQCQLPRKNDEGDGASRPGRNEGKWSRTGLTDTIGW